MGRISGIFLKFLTRRNAGLYLSGEEEGSTDRTNRKGPLELGSVHHILFTNASFSRQEANYSVSIWGLLCLGKLPSIFSLTLSCFFIFNHIICSTQKKEIILKVNLFQGLLRIKDSLHLPSNINMNFGK